MAGNASLSTALFVLPGKSQTWLFDYACCNHMAPHSSLFSKLNPPPHPLNIHITYGFTMHRNNLGFVLTSNLSVPRVFHVLDLSYNLCSVGQLAKLGYRLIFYYSGCIVQDSRTGQELGTGPRVRRMFPSGQSSSSTCCSCFCCCCSFFLTISCTLTFSSWSCIIFSGTTVNF